MSKQERTLAIKQWHKTREDVQKAYDTFYSALVVYIETPTTSNRQACRKQRALYEAVACKYNLAH